MKNKRIFNIIAMIAIIGFGVAAMSLTGCETDGTTDSAKGGIPANLVGTWGYAEGDIEVLIINANGSGSWQGSTPQDCTWSVSGSVLTTTIDGQTGSATYQITGGKLKFSDPQGILAVMWAGIMATGGSLDKLSSGGNKTPGSNVPDKLANGATISQALAALDAIIANPNTPADTKEAAEATKIVLTTPGFEQTWVSSGPSYISIINGYIDTIPESSNQPPNGNTPELPDPLPDNARASEALAKLDEIINCPGVPQAIKDDAKLLKDSINILTWSSTGSSVIDAINSLIEDMANSGGNGKPAYLPNNATSSQASAKLDEIIAYPETPQAVKDDAQMIKNGMSNFILTWQSTGSMVIDAINELIDEIPGGGKDVPINPNVETYQVIFYPRNGEIYETQTFTVTRGGTVRPPTVSRNGYTFGGWYQHSYDSGILFTSSTRVYDNIEVYALWNQNQGTVSITSINANYSGTTVPLGTSLDYLKNFLTVTAHYSNGGSEILEPLKYTLSGYLRTGICTITVSYEGRSASFLVTVVEGGFPPDPGQITVRYDYGNGWFEYEEKYTPGETVWISHAPPDRDGYFFYGWNTDPNGYGQWYNVGESYTISANTTLYAMWKDEEIYITGIEVIYTQSSIPIFPTTPLDDLKNNLSVVAYHSNGAVEWLSPWDYNLYGNLYAGQCEITVEWNDFTAIFYVWVQEEIYITGISVTVYPLEVESTTSLDSLKNNLSVVAYHSNGESEILDPLKYTLSGQLIVGENIITVTYEEWTTTFPITVTLGGWT